MFRKILFAAMCATAAGYCFAAENLPQVVTSEVFYDQDVVVDENTVVVEEFVEDVPAWPIAGSDADVEIACDSGVADMATDNIRIVSKIGDDLVVENNINMGTRGEFAGWSGGANMLHGMQVPAGFGNECDGAQMPLLTREMLEDDGGSVLTVSRSSRKNCGKYADDYAAFALREGMNQIDEVVEESVEKDTDEIQVAESADAEAPRIMKDQVRSWVVANGQTLRDILQSWCDKEGWDLVWATSREYPIQASAVFKGRFVDVASALVRNFGRATPAPYAKFYKGNRVLVITTNEQ